MSWGAVPCVQAEGMAKASITAGSASSEAENMSQRDKHRDTYKAMILPLPGHMWMISVITLP